MPIRSDEHLELGPRRRAGLGGRAAVPRAGAPATAPTAPIRSRLPNVAIRMRGDEVDALADRREQVQDQRRRRSVTAMKVGHIHAPRSRQRMRAGQKRSSRSTGPQSSLRSVAELWVAQLGTVPYRDGVGAPGDAPRAPSGRRDSRTCCSCSSIRRCTRRAGAPSPATCRWARTGTARRASRSSDTDRGGRVTYHGPGQLVAYPIMAVDRVADFVHTMEGAIVAALADEGIAAEAARHAVHRRVGGRREDRARSACACRGGVSTHGLAVNVDNDLQPFEWIVPCGIDHVRVTSRVEGDRPRPARCPASASGWPGGSPRRSGMRQRLVSRAAGCSSAPRGGGMSTRSRANPGGARVLERWARCARSASASRRGSSGRRRAAPRYRELRGMIEGEGLHTVCQEAACPNIGECWERGTATFMILGDTCTRRCGFCNVKTGKPTYHDPLEPLRVAQSVKRMGLRHAVITSVDRDDLPDLGATRLRRRDPLDPAAWRRAARSRCSRPTSAARRCRSRA